MRNDSRTARLDEYRTVADTDHFSLGGRAPMLTKAQAMTLVANEIARPPKYRYPGDPTDLVIVDEGTIERDWGWVFFYTSERHLQTGDMRHAIAGNAPYIVNRHTAELRATGTAMPVEQYIEEYERELARR